ncbi:MAG: ATP-dependent RecD-like DNA helicase [Clostridia bacterium]|nr:ATP-dependent RecD-like DNA helicase [Clostridia bacterium]
MREHEKIRISGVVNHVTFTNKENGFTVLELESGDELVTAVGVMPELNAGELLELSGYWDFHASFGRQFKVEMCERRMPASAGDILRYLSSGGVKGIGPKTAVKVVERFGEETFEVLENEPERLAQIKGISLEKAKEISADFKKQFAVREIMIALERYGMTTAECVAAFRVFGARASDIITRNPYALCSEGVGFSFSRAETVAQALPSPPDKGYRLQAGVLHVMSHNLSNGHTCIPRDKLFAPCAELLSTNDDTVDITIDELVGSGRLVSRDINGREFLFLPYIYKAEKNAAEHIKQLLKFPPAGRPAPEKEVDRLEKQTGIKYGKRQREAIITAVEKGMLILTGGPGTGKTTTLNGILRFFEEDGLKVALAAPTGRAAKRMSEVTGRNAKTIHRLLEVEWDKNDRPQFSRNARNPLEANAVILDELSMVDITLFSSFLEALPIGCRLIMVGDSDQLPPVGAGNVLHDLISSGEIPVVELKEVFRQAMESLIVENAHRIVKGDAPILNVSDKDFFFIQNESPFLAAKSVTDLCTARLPKAYGYSPLDNIQVICPSRMGDSGTYNLNRMLQSALNPQDAAKAEITVAGTVFREGDKVMQTRNNYNIEWTSSDSEGTGIFNGDIGMLRKIDMRTRTVDIMFDDRKAVFPFESLQELELAYAVTVHKSQGNEFDVVVMPVAGVPPRLAYRNLLYTGVTRAKKMLVLVGSKRQVCAMAANDKKARRYSALEHFLKETEK